MEFADVLAQRRMVRSYLPDPVDPVAVDRILDAARRAPSAGFSQPHRFVVVTSREGRDRIAAACGEPAALARGLRPWLSVAPVHIVPCVDIGAYDRRYAEADKADSGGPADWDVPFHWVDGGAALMLLLLAAVDEGLGAGFLWVAEDVIRSAAQVPSSWTPLGLVTLGYPANTSPVGSVVHRRRLGLSEAVVRR